MKNPEGVVKRWSVFVAVVAVAASVGAIGCLSRIGTPDWSLENLLPQFAIGLIIISVLLWAGVISSLKKNNPKLAGVLIIIAGVMSLPAGILLIIAGIRLRSAARTLGQQQQPVSSI